ncbi:MAG: NUDIX hydrolase [Nocardiopsis sp. BM-2018]|nr:MAG: NUDIX hydrolase [Nocardiopsis sp. BM-2018]
MTAEPGFEHIADSPVHAGRVWDVVVAEFRAPDGASFLRDVVRSGGAVAIVPLVFDPEGNASVVLVEQYRGPYDQLVIEIPAGMRDVPGEPLDETARRELREEVGLVAAEVVHLLDLYPSPGMTDQVTTVFLATGCQAVERAVQGPEEAYSTVLHLPLADALEMIDDGRIRDAKTVAGLLSTDRTLRRADER